MNMMKSHGNRAPPVAGRRSVEPDKPAADASGRTGSPPGPDAAPSYRPTLAGGRQMNNLARSRVVRSVTEVCAAPNGQPAPAAGAPTLALAIRC